MAELTAFSSSGADAISRTIELDDREVSTQLSGDELDDVFDVARTVADIIQGNYKRIAMQFPDELLVHSVPIYRSLKSKIGEERELYVLADTSYGSCCVDEVAAQHVDADALVHYGHACMSQTSRLPVIHVFGKKPLDAEHCARSFVETAEASGISLEGRAILLRYDVAYAHAAGSVVEQLTQRLQDTARVLHAAIPLSTRPSASSQKPPNGTPPTEEVPEPEGTPETLAILFIGEESLTLTNLLMTHSSYEVISYNPRTRSSRQETGRTNKLLMRRYAVVQRARDADVIGILVGTLGVANYLPLISHLRAMIKRARKKSYTISVGKPNPAKLGNFLEIECFVLVACPENSLLDAKEFLRPIATPYELEIALQSTPNWTGRYILSFEEVLASRDESSTEPPASGSDEEDPDRPSFSLVTGKYRYAKRYGESVGDDSPTKNGTSVSSAVVLRNQENALSKMEDSAAAQFLQGRSFQGLETRVGQDAPSILEQGLNGIAREYQDDHRQS